MKKILNNVVRFSAAGKDVDVRLSDKELTMLRQSSIYSKGTDLTKMNYALIYNFSLYAYFDYDLKNTKKGWRVKKAFPYHDYDKIMWDLIKHDNINNS